MPSAEDVSGVVVYVTPTENSTRSVKDVSTTIIPLINSAKPGSSKPPTSPYHPDFKMLKNEDQLGRAKVEDLSWLLAHYCHCNAVSLQCKDAQESD